MNNFKETRINNLLDSKMTLKFFFRHTFAQVRNNWRPTPQQKKDRLVFTLFKHINYMMRTWIIQENQTTVPQCSGPFTLCKRVCYGVARWYARVTSTALITQVPHCTQSEGRPLGKQKARRSEGHGSGALDSGQLVLTALLTVSPSLPHNAAA